MSEGLQIPPAHRGGLELLHLPTTLQSWIHKCTNTNRQTKKYKYGTTKIQKHKCTTRCAMHQHKNKNTCRNIILFLFRTCNNHLQAVTIKTCEKHDFKWFCSDLLFY